MDWVWWQLPTYPNQWDKVDHNLVFGAERPLVSESTVGLQQGFDYCLSSTILTRKCLMASSIDAFFLYREEAALEVKTDLSTPQDLVVGECNLLYKEILSLLIFPKYNWGLFTKHTDYNENQICCQYIEDIGGNYVLLIWLDHMPITLYSIRLVLLYQYIHIKMTRPPFGKSSAPIDWLFNAQVEVLEMVVLGE